MSFPGELWRLWRGSANLYCSLALRVVFRMSKQRQRAMPYVWMRRVQKISRQRRDPAGG